MEVRSKLRMGSVIKGSREQRTGKLRINFWLCCYLAVSVSGKLLLSFAKPGITDNRACGERVTKLGCLMSASPARIPEQSLTGGVLVGYWGHWGHWGHWGL